MSDQWNLELIYPSLSDWETDFKTAEKDILSYESLKGTFHTKEGLLQYAKIQRTCSERISKLYTYAMMAYDLNQKDTAAYQNYQRIYSLYNAWMVQTSFIEPELISIGKETVFQLLDEEKELSVLRYRMDQLFRNQTHYLDAKSEGLMANYNEALGKFNQLYDQLAVADNTSSQISLSDGSVLEVNESNFQYYLEQLSNQEDRKKVFEAIYLFYEKHKNTFAGIYSGILASEMAVVKNRGYGSILESHLDRNAIPVEVVMSLIETAKTHAEPLKEYYALRKSFFHLEHLHTYDRFLKFATSQRKYSYQEAKEMVLDACRILGDDYYQHAQKVLEDGRVSVYASEGKRTGAYSTSLYQEGAFILLNHNDNLESAFTIAHEAGHSIHSLYANEHQPLETADYEIFVAEIASTFNEQLFLDYRMSHSEDKTEKIVLLQQAIDNIVATFYRQTLFADFEYQAHRLAEQNEPITAQALEAIMEQLYLDYYGIDLKTEPYKNNVWAYIPHFFHTPFYVYQYATSFAASMAIYEKVKNQEKGALEQYLSMLSKGGSDYPVNLVLQGGVDLRKPEPFLAVVHRLQELLDELKKLLQ